MIKAESKYILVDDLKVHYLMLGEPATSKQVLLVLHGWNTTGSGIWKDFVDLFGDEADKQQICIIAPDLPGFAASSQPQSVWKVQDYAVFCRHLLEALNISEPDSVSVLGHSFGGGVASVLGCSYKLKQLFLAAPAIIRLPPAKTQDLLTGITKFAKRFVKSTFLRKIWYRLIGSPDYVQTSGIMQEIFKVVVSEDLTNILHNITIPTTIIWGNKDNYTPVWQAEIIQQNIKNSQLVILPDINHGLHIYATQKLYQILKHDLNL